MEIKKAGKNHTTGLHSIAQSSLHLYTAHSSFIAQKACIRRVMLHNRGAQDSDERNALQLHPPVKSPSTDTVTGVNCVDYRYFSI